MSTIRFELLWLLPLLAFGTGGCGGGGPGMTLGKGDAGAPDLSMKQGGGDVCSTLPPDPATSQKRARQCGLGTDAAVLLRAAPYPKVIVEVAATTGAAPRQGAIDHLVRVLGDVCDKPGGITVKMGAMNIPSPGHPLSVDDVRALEDAHRTQFALGDTAVFFYLVVADPSADDTAQGKVLGIAHRASSMVVFQGTVDSVSGGLGQPSNVTVESTVVAHELGHVLGLVNISTPMVTPHEDPVHTKHDQNDKCLMFWANNSSAGLANLLGGGQIADFDAQCRADLLAIRNAK